MMAYLFILFSAGCSVIIVHLLKLTEVRGYRTLHTLTVNYLFAGVIALLLGLWDADNTSLSTIAKEPGVIIFCILAGALFIGNFMMYSKSVHANGVGVTVASMRVSLLVPVLTSIILYGEQISWLKWLGIVLVIGSLLLMIPTKNPISTATMNAGWLLIGIFLVAGFADATLKIYEDSFGSQLNEMLFMSFVFAAAFLIGMAAICFRNEIFFTRNEILMGSLIGIPNLYSSVFLIYALSDMAGAIAFPLVNILIVAGGTGIGLWFWKDEISGSQWLGIAIAIIAILLLLL